MKALIQHLSQKPPPPERPFQEDE